MVQDQESKKRTGSFWWWRHFLGHSIRGKIILPYLILTLVVAIIGTYVVIRLVASSLDERLTNQVLEAGRVVSDSVASLELSHIDSAQSVAFTTGLAEALQSGEQSQVAKLARPTASVKGVESLIVVDAQGDEVLHLLRQNGKLQIIEEERNASRLWMVQALLSAGDPRGTPKRGLGLHLTDQRYYYFTAVPVELEGELVGVVVIGTSLDTLMPRLKTTSLADVVIYRDGGHAIATTFAFVDQSAEAETGLDELSITPELYQKILHNQKSTMGENLEMHGRSYRLARGPLRVGDDLLGVFAVALPSNFIVQAGTTSRNTYTLIFVVATVGVIVIGYLISQRITAPLGQLVHTSRAVAEGRLNQRTGIVSADEIGILATTFDEMTDRLEERTHVLEETVSRMRAILSSIGDGVLLEDMEGNFIPLNTTAEKLLEEMAANFLLGPLREPLAEDYSEEDSDQQQSPWLLERRRFEVGNKVVNAHSAAVQTGEGQRLGTVIVLRDVTAEVEAEQLKDAFVTHVSHELRTPLTAIKGYSDLLLVSTGEALNEEQRNFLKRIKRHTDNLVAMINALLDFSEMEARGRLGLQQKPVLLSAFVEDIAEEWRPRMEEKELTFEVESPTDLPPVNVDAERMRWAVVNLVRNAWQYTPSGGSVKMQLSSQDNEVVLEITDTGMGIPAEDHERVFSRFYNVAQVRNTDDDNERGLGLSLYVSKVIIESHQGEIQVTSEEGVGSTFSVILPALPEEA